MMAVFIAIIFGIFSFIIFGELHTGNQPVVKSQFEPGLTWFGADGVYQKTTADKPNRYFDSVKPTIIFIHGWLPDQVGEPPTFMVEFPAPGQNSTSTLDLAAPWVDAGWNIGIFYWHPFSDEARVWDAEDNIWAPDEEIGMRYRDVEGNYHSEGMPSVSVSELLLEDYLAAMADFTGLEIRVAGHSLGYQLAVNLTTELVKMAETGDISENLLPTRVALLDPFWSPFPKSYLGDLETGEYIQQEIEQNILPKNILVEWYHSSWLTESTMIRAYTPTLKAQVVYAELDPRYCDLLDQVCKHDGAWHLYFLSYGSPPSPECVLDDGSEFCNATGESGPMASSSNERIAEMMNLAYYWVQEIGPDGIDGRLTPQTDDDWFHRLPDEAESE